MSFGNEDFVLLLGGDPALELVALRQLRGEGEGLKTRLVDETSVCFVI